MSTHDRQLQKALALHRAGRSLEAAVMYRRVLKRDPRQPDALHLLGALLVQTGHVEEGIASIRRAIAGHPSATYYNSLGNALQALGDALAAEGAFRRAIEIDTGYAAAHANLGDLFAAHDRHADAVVCYEAGVRLAPDDAGTHCNLGSARRAMGDHQRAIASYRRALALRPELAAAHVNLGNALRDLGELDEAIASYRRGVALAPDAADAHVNLGEAYREAGDPHAAIACQRRAVQLEPHSSAAHYDLARALLTVGDFENGWREYQWCEAARQSSARCRSLPRWNGAALDGRALLIDCNGPLGTQLLFASILRDLADHRGRIVLRCEPRLVPLFGRSFPHVEVRPSHLDADTSEPMRPAVSDLHIPLLGLPELFRRRLSDFPRHDGYLAADSTKREASRRRLARGGNGMVVGLSWRAGATPEERRKRAIPLARFREIVDVPGVTFVSLQQGASADEDAGDGRTIAVRLRAWPDIDPVADLDGFAALVSELDLVISADNSTAHLAGALSVPVWTLLPVGADWRWLTDRVDCIWFPSMRLFRQRVRGDWLPVVAGAADALRRIVTAGPTRRAPRAA